MPNECGCQALNPCGGGCEQGFNFIWLILIVLVIVIAFQHY